MGRWYTWPRSNVCEADAVREAAETGVVSRKPREICAGNWLSHFRSCVGWAQSEHRDEAAHAARGDEVLQRVAAHGLPEGGKDLSIGQFQSLGGGIRGQARHDEAGPTRRVEHENQRDERQRSELHHEIGAQIARACSSLQYQ